MRWTGDSPPDLTPNPVALQHRGASFVVAIARAGGILHCRGSLKPVFRDSQRHVKTQGLCYLLDD